MISNAEAISFISERQFLPSVPPRDLKKLLHPTYLVPKASFRGQSSQPHSYLFSILKFRFLMYFKHLERLILCANIKRLVPLTNFCIYYLFKSSWGIIHIVHHTTNVVHLAAIWIFSFCFIRFFKLLLKLLYEIIIT